MTQYVPTWYERYWKNSPPTKKEQVETVLTLFHTIREKADILGLTAQLDDALMILNTAERLAEHTHHIVWQCRLRNTKASILQGKGDFSAALDLVKAVAEQLKNRTDEPARRVYGSACNTMGIVYGQQGYAARSLRCFEEDKRIQEEIGDRHGYGSALGNMGITYHKQGDYTRALRCYEEARQIYQDSGDRLRYGLVVGNIGLLYGDQGDYERALHSYEEARQIYEKIGARQGYGLVLGSMGGVNYLQGDFKRALRCYEEARQVYEDIGDRHGYSRAVGNMGFLHHEQGDYERALRCYEEARQIYEATGNRQAFGIVLGNMGKWHYDQGHLEQALDYFETAIAIHRELSANYFLCEELIRKAHLLLDRQDYVAAQSCAAEGVTLAAELPQPDTLFKGRVLQAKIAFHAMTNAELRMTNAVDVLEKMLLECDPSTFQGQEQQATLNYELRMMNDELGRTEQAEAHRQAALELYQKLYEKTPKFEYKKRIEELSQ